MVREKYGVRLTPEQRNQLQRLVRAGKGAARVTIRARILLKTDAGWSAPQVAEALDVAEGTVYRTKRRFAEAGLGVLQDRPQAHRCRKLDDRGEAHLIALACPTRRKGMNTGPCACWPARWWSWGGALPIPRDGAAAPEKKRPQALAEAGMVHPPGERRVSWPTWRTCWICTPNPMTPSGRWSALTRPPPSCWPRSGSRCQPSRGVPSVRIASTDGRAPATCSWPVSRWPAGGRWRLPRGARCRTSPTRCAGWVDQAYPEVPVVRVVLDKPETPHRNGVRCTRLSRPERPGVLRNDWSFTTSPSTAVGSIWRR